MKSFIEFLENYTPEEIKTANATSRNKGAVGSKAITPKYVATIANKDHEILDFGAGRAASHAKTLRKQGLNVTAHEFGDNQTEDHDPKALSRKYDIVYASNVLNTQSSRKMLTSTLAQIRSNVRKGGSFVANLPMSPRKSDDVDHKTLETELRKHFNTVSRVGGTRSAPLFHATDQ